MSAELLQKLIEAGTPAALVAEVALLVGEVGALERRRASDRERQAARRHVTSRDSADVTDSHDPAPSFDKSPPDPQKLNPTPCVRPAREAAYHRLPENWVPSRALPPKTQAKADQWPPGTLEDELAAFHRWAANASNEKGKGRKLDWDKAWVNWIERRHDERHSRPLNGSHAVGRNQPSDGLSATTRAALAVFGPGDEQPVPRRADSVPRLGGAVWDG